MTLVLYRWHLDAAGCDPPANRRRLVDRVVMPLFRDPAVLADAECLYAGKYFPPGYPIHEVQLTLLADQTRHERAAEAVRAHLTGVPNQPIGPERNDALCLDECAQYRPRLMDVTRVALDLHGNPAHVGEVSARWGNDAELHVYLSAHSAAYRQVCDTDAARVAFWREFWTPGPRAELNFPGHWIESLLSD